MLISPSIRNQYIIAKMCLLIRITWPTIYLRYRQKSRVEYLRYYASFISYPFWWNTIMHLFREKGPWKPAVSHISKTRFKAEKCLKRPPNSSNYKAFEFRRLVLQCAVSVVCSCLAGRWSARLVLRQHQRFVGWTLHIDKVEEKYFTT